MIICETCKNKIDYEEDDTFVVDKGKYYYHLDCIPSDIIQRIMDTFPSAEAEKEYQCPICKDTGMVETSYYDGVERNYDKIPCRDCNKGYMKTSKNTLTIMREYMDTIFSRIETLQKEITRIEKKEKGK